MELRLGIRINLQVTFIFIFAFVTSVLSWDFAVTLKDKILFYDEHWSFITSGAHQFDGLSAIEFDETAELIYFNDKNHQNGSIFTLKLSIDEKSNHITENILSRSQNESIAAMAFDPLDRILYWTDAVNLKIYTLRTDIRNDTPKILYDFKEEGSIPDGISIDICRRKLYWTNSNHKMPTIERSFLNGTGREILINSSLFLPHGIAVDQFSDRIYWVHEQGGIHYSVESSNFDGSDRQIIVQGMNSNPFHLAVTKNSIYWTDSTNNAVWNISKLSYQDEKPNKVQVFSLPPKGVVARRSFLTKMENDVNCKDVVKRIKKRLLESAWLTGQTESASLATNEQKDLHHKRELFCLNKGEYNPRSGACICKIGFTGIRCEINICHNFCVHGACSMSSTGFPECTCQEGFIGERCEISKCTNYCYNGGTCEIKDNVPVCHCADTHDGSRCERNSTEICSLYCEILKHNPEKEIPFECYNICDDVVVDLGDITTQTFKNHQMKNITNDPYMLTCNSVYNKTIIFIVCGVLTALILVYLIIQALRRIYKPARPRIKKTFVVQKKVSQTPLTSRPVSTEQCEITIENCCNMNICDTPCFDPKLLQQNMSFDKSKKEDKKILINHMEDDLY